MRLWIEGLEVDLPLIASRDMYQLSWPVFRTRGLTIAEPAGILGHMIAELHINRNWWWLPQKEWVAG